MGIPASFEILRNWSVKPLRKDAGQKNKNKTGGVRARVSLSKHLLKWDLHNPKYYYII